MYWSFILETVWLAIELLLSASAQRQERVSCHRLAQKKKKSQFKIQTTIFFFKVRFLRNAYGFQTIVKSNFRKLNSCKLGPSVCRRGKAGSRILHMLGFTRCCQASFLSGYSPTSSGGTPQCPHLHWHWILAPFAGPVVLWGSLGCHNKILQPGGCIKAET